MDTAYNRNGVLQLYPSSTALLKFYFPAVGPTRITASERCHHSHRAQKATSKSRFPKDAQSTANPPAARTDVLVPDSVPVPLLELLLVPCRKTALVPVVLVSPRCPLAPTRRLAMQRYLAVLKLFNVSLYSYLFLYDNMILVCVPTSDNDDKKCQRQIRKNEKKYNELSSVPYQYQVRYR